MCLRFLPGAEEYYDLRGGPVFERNADQVNGWLGRLLTHLNGGHRILLHNPDKSEGTTFVVDLSARCETWFLQMPSSPHLARILEDRPFNTLIVDYTGDALFLLHPDDAAPDMKRAGQAMTDVAWRWWSQPERQESLTRGLNAADVITTSWAGLVGPLAQRFGKPVIHLPDTRPGATKAFRKVWNRQVIPAMRRAQEERRGRG